MTPEQERHLESLIVQHATAFEAKYRKGQGEHGGTLSNACCAKLLDAALEEVLDLWAYLQTLKQKQVEPCGCHVRTAKTALGDRECAD